MKVVFGAVVYVAFCDDKFGVFKDLLIFGSFEFVKALNASGVTKCKIIKL